ncbi:mimivirus peptide chain release factor eRF1 [Tupanvirus deep ocean]|uniref:Mimivirus peptide chain release factor eRF1 n=2 Tax=Tupanvirus TaxID=2094720 RepID=A0AC62AAE3_9VIRU|nr:mimivirus peptide chain release factor eRF1 [Tupanvirus deep ocean]QKU34620.1 mimivirus peptide chain release factor eRF1 [Tupanvirus deep ocean]
MVQYYVKEGKFQCKGLVIAGPAEMKNMVKDEELFIKYFSKFLIKTVTIAEITSRSIYQVINSAADVLTSENCEKEIVSSFEDMITDPKMIELLIFGTNESQEAFDNGELKEIYVYHTYSKKDSILNSDTKTKINIIKSNEFRSKYGDLVGVKYYASYDMSDLSDNNNSCIVDV